MPGAAKRGASPNRPSGALPLLAAWVLLIGILGGAVGFAVLGWDPEEPRQGLAWDFGLPAPAPGETVVDKPETVDEPEPATEAEVETAGESASPDQASGPIELVEPGAADESGATTNAAETAAPARLPGKPRIAVVITGLGLDSEATRAAIEALPDRISLSFSPYAENLTAWIARARRHGHEALLDLPMEPVNFPRDDPGPRALLTGLQPDQNLDRLRWVLGRGKGYRGLAVFMGSRFVTSSADLKPVLREIADRRLFLLDNAGGGSQVAALAGEAGLSHATVDRILDEGAPGPETLAARLVQAERLAVANGSSVATARVNGLVIESIAAWSAGLADRGLELVPVGGLLERRPEG